MPKRNGAGEAFLRHLEDRGRSEGRLIIFDACRCLPIGLGYLEGITDYYVRVGTTTLLAALDVANGTALMQGQSTHLHQKFLEFLRQIEAYIPDYLDVRLISDDYGTHKRTLSKVSAGTSISYPSALHAALPLV